MNIDERITESFILFELAGTTYGLKSSDVLQLEMVENITAVPNSDPTVEGVMFSRGQIIPAINLRTRFGFEKAPFDMRSRVIVVRAHERNIGLIVDSAREFKRIPEESIIPPPDAISYTDGRYLNAIATVDETTVLLLDLEELIRPQIAAAVDEVI